MPKIAAGLPAPDVVLRDLSGLDTTISQYKDKVVLLTFWNMKCSDCIESMASLELLNQRFKDQGLIVLAINADNPDYVGPEKIGGLIKQKGFNFKVLLDETFSASEAYRIVAIPMTFLIDKNGIISYMEFGKEDWTSQGNVARVQGLLTDMKTNKL